MSSIRGAYVVGVQQVYKRYAKIPRTILEWCLKMRLGTETMKELEKFVVLAWPALVPLKHTYTYMRLVKCKHRSLYKMQPDSIRITKLIYTSKTTYIHILILNSKENGFQCSLTGTRLILTKLCTLEDLLPQILISIVMSHVL